jgi:hypothetical protein
MATVEFRPARLIRVDALPAPGCSSPYVTEIQNIGQEIADVESDDASGTVLPPLWDLLRTMGKVYEQHVWMADDVRRRTNDPMFIRMVQRSAEQAFASRQLTPGGAPFQEMERSVLNSRELAAAQLDATKSVVEAARAKLDALNAKLAEAPAAAVAAIESAKAEFESPSALRSDIEIVDLQKRRDCEEEIKSKPDPLGYALAQLDRMIRHDKQDLLKNFAPACVRVANWIIEQPRPKRGARREAIHDRGYTNMFEDAEITKARKVLRLLAAWDQQQAPKSIAAAESLLLRVRPIFTALCGINDVPFNVRSRSYYTDGDGSQKPAPDWEVDDEWPLRFLPPSVTPLPGWCPIVGRTDGGVVVRDSQPLVAAEVKV